mmetsp:Transcript_1722/g.3815  ORF Transcript_1722/g.3815 Transcript_1722/m.3815 type:complete len:382 (-) Transcript_1722:279-1424(-)|eukprot:CAMPEP_0204274720 /NCGR_PEP_ID=MMETSP0468-20130131/25350_1 /ASSEMBLY_ACC=CAM_ASM_000383 /TAXON_ID=2969 /ORGANISM="Oxyrrhis marina" /LENGTH=381 /DNA_ID=CAMNT_0051250969 /DNA_START=46 /DNA_END=1191 /DNA_ORIENTATION=-
MGAKRAASPRAAQAPKAKAKKTAQPKADPVEVAIGRVSTALVECELPKDTDSLLIQLLPMAAAQFKSQRHKYTAQTMQWIQAALQARHKKLVDEKAQLANKVATASESKATAAAKKDKCEERAKSTGEAASESSAKAKETQAALKAARKDAVVVVNEEKLQLAKIGAEQRIIEDIAITGEHLKALCQPDGTPGPRADTAVLAFLRKEGARFEKTCFVAVPAALKAKPAERTDFQKDVIRFVEKYLVARKKECEAEIVELNKKLAEIRSRMSPVVAAEANHDAAVKADEQAQSAAKDAAAALAEATAASKQLDKELASAADDIEAKTTAITHATEDIAAFEMLRDREPEPEPAPPAAEPSTPAAASSPIPDTAVSASTMPAA